MTVERFSPSSSFTHYWRTEVSPRSHPKTARFTRIQNRTVSHVRILFCLWFVRFIRVVVTPRKRVFLVKRRQKPFFRRFSFVRRKRNRSNDTKRICLLKTVYTIYVTRPWENEENARIEQWETRVKPRERAVCVCVRVWFWDEPGVQYGRHDVFWDLPRAAARGQHVASDRVPVPTDATDLLGIQMLPRPDDGNDCQTACTRVWHSQGCVVRASAAPSYAYMSIILIIIITRQCRFDCAVFAPPRFHEHGVKTTDVEWPRNTLNTRSCTIAIVTGSVLICIS